MKVEIVNRHRVPGIGPTILIAMFVVAAVVLGQPAPGTPGVGSATTDSAHLGSPTIARPGPSSAPVAASPRATPRGKEIYKGHTLAEIRADPSLLAEILAEADYIRPIHGEPVPPLRDTGSDTICPNHVECP